MFQACDFVVTQVKHWNHENYDKNFNENYDPAKKTHSPAYNKSFLWNILLDNTQSIYNVKIWLPYINYKHFKVHFKGNWFWKLNISTNILLI